MNRDEPRKQLSQVIDPLVDDILSLSDDEIAAEVQEAGGDLALLAAEVGRELSAALSMDGKRRLAAARSQLDGVRALRSHPSITGLPVAEKERLLRQFSANDNPLQKRLTMAARNGEGLTEAEMDSVLLDLVELGALDNEGNIR